VSETIKITVDGREVEAAPGELVIAAAERTGTYIPRFCWHPRMEPVGMCRMCLVEVEGPRGRQLTTSCTLRAAPDMVVDTQSDVVKKAQEGVLEFLLINHPLDCPVCDRAGECPLQDQTMAYGPGESRFVEEKRHFKKPIPISDVVMLDRERCILCARCTRFSDEIAGDPLIEFMDRGYGTQILTFPDEPFSSYFSGNTVQLCPVGALTATPYRFKARPWDLEAVESTCPHCSVGCRMSVQASQNEVLRFLGVDVDPTNQGWLCDKGRFGFEFINSTDRLQTPLVRDDDGELAAASWSDALDLVARRLVEIRDASGPDAIAGLGGAKGTNEEAYAFARLMKGTIGTDSVDAQMGDGLDPRFLAWQGSRATIDDLERAAAVLVWGPDLKEELPVLHLRVRRAATRLGARVVVVSPRATGLDPDAAHTIRYRPGEGAATLARLAAGDGDLKAAREALSGGPVVAIVGRTGLTEAPDLAEAVAAFALADLPEARVMPIARRGNVYGAIDMGLAPGLLPGRVEAGTDAASSIASAWGSVPAAKGRDATGILSGLADGSVKALVMVGADPVTDHPDRAAAEAALQNADFVVSIDLFHTESNRHADVVLPALAFAETEGTVTNLEGRVQKVNRIVPGPGQARAGWEILVDLGGRLGGPSGTSAEALAKEIATTAPAYAGVTWDDLDWGGGRDGIVVPTNGQAIDFTPTAGATDTPGGDLVLHLARTLYDRGTLVANGASIAALAPGPAVHLHPDDAERLGLAVGDRARLRGSTVPVRVDASLAPGTVYVPFDNGLSAGPGLEVTLEKA
jgi:NADH-quinone oxidoreductase subunit G